jgi:hypothetical protein
MHYLIIIFLHLIFAIVCFIVYYKTDLLYFARKMIMLGSVSYKGQGFNFEQSSSYTKQTTCVIWYKPEKIQVANGLGYFLPTSVKKEHKVLIFWTSE